MSNSFYVQSIPQKDKMQRTPETRTSFALIGFTGYKPVW